MYRGLRKSILAFVLSTGALGVLGAQQAQGIDVKVKDLTTSDGAVPIRLVGYGIVVGLDGSGDRNLGSFHNEGPTVLGISNLLSRLHIAVPPEAIKSRNAAAVLVTAEVSPYARPGTKFEVKVASLGDAHSLRGGMLWITPLLLDPKSPPVASAQGSISISDGNIASRASFTTGVETSGKIIAGGLVDGDLPKTDFASNTHLYLRDPDITTAMLVAAAVNGAAGANTAKVEDPGTITLTIAGAERAAVWSKIQEARVRVETPNRLVLDATDGTVTAGGSITVGAATVSHGAITLIVGGAGGGKGAVSVVAGSTVGAVAAALRAVDATPSEVGAIFEALREAGAIGAEVIVR